MNGGIKRTVARLKKLVAAVENAGEEAVYASAAECAALAKRYAPVDTGFLRGSINAVSGGAYTALVVASAPYAAMVEYGTSKMPQQPFMLPAAYDTAESFFSNAAMLVNRAAKEI